MPDDINLNIFNINISVPWFFQQTLIKQDTFESLNNNFSDFEDSIQYSTALKVDNLDAIITRNIRDYKKSKVTVLTPEMFLNKFYSN